MGKANGKPCRMPKKPVIAGSDLRWFPLLVVQVACSASRVLGRPSGRKTVWWRLFDDDIGDATEMHLGSSS